MENLALVEAIIGSGFTLIGVLVINWWRSRNDKTRAQAVAMEVMSQALQTALSSLTSLQTQIKSLLDERTAANSARIEAQNQMDALKDDLRRIECDSENSKARLAAEITSLQARVKQLGQEGEQKDNRITLLLGRVEMLEREARQKDQKIEELNLALTQSEADKRELSARLAELETKINGKADKPPTSGEDLTASVDKVRECSPEPGEIKIGSDPTGEDHVSNVE